MWGRTLGVAIWLALLLVLLELAARVVFPLPEALGFDRGRYAHLGIAPGAEAPDSLGHLSFLWASDPDGFEYVHRLNLYGFRDREWTLAPPEAAERILFVGDSFVEGFSAGAEETLPAVFAELVAGSGRAVEVLNLGIAGADLSAYARLVRDAVPLFRPRAVILVLFANDLVPTRADPAWLGEPLPVERVGPWEPRLLRVARRLWAGRRVPRRWHEPPFPFLAPVPDPRNPWTDGRLAGRLSAFVTPEIARAIRAGRFNPMLVDAMPRFGKHLRRPVEIGDVLRAVAGSARRHGAKLGVVYVPTKHQVTDRYLEAQADFSPPGTVASLTGEEFQLHARMLAESCRRQGLPFLDLTPILREREAAGPPLYWVYDDHMRAAGYRAAAEAVFAWWRAEPTWAPRDQIAARGRARASSTGP